ncbi:MAG: ABC transporter permease, partial [Candidatus Thiodiazotropha sp. (ex Cardiolucina cf. quadrata)]|nr:ABC transporter permease [Candidatus Thiodiazotropha sp. (ex Cardiolucina cf. quadrata)]
MLILWAVAAVTGTWFSESGNLIALDKILHPPGLSSLLGYDDLGRPILPRLLSGAQTSFLVSVGVVTLSAISGTLLGLLAGFQGGWFDLLLTRVIDIFLAFPGILLAIAL